LDISPFWIPLIYNEVSKSNWKFVWSYSFFIYTCRIQFRGSGLVPQMSPAVTWFFISIRFHIFPMIFILFLACFVGFNSYIFTLLVSDVCMFATTFFIVMLLLPLIDTTCYRVFIGYSCSDM
jgi:hypothetical protein